MNSLGLNIVIVALGAVAILVASDHLLTLLNRGGLATRAAEAEAEPEAVQIPVVLESAADGGFIENEHGELAA